MAVLIAVVLAVAWTQGGGLKPSADAAVAGAQDMAADRPSPSPAVFDVGVAEVTASPSEAPTAAAATETAADAEEETEEANTEETPDTAADTKDAEEADTEGALAATETPTAEPTEAALTVTTDPYRTDPVPPGKPLPMEPQEAVVGTGVLTCTLSVRCDTVLANMSSLNPNKVELVPEDGVIFPPTVVTFYEGESVFNVLQREMRRNGIHMEFVNTPIYNSAYIEGIHNLYEFDVGGLSGWMYKVNGWFPNYGCSRYMLQDGDVVEWVYTCDLGRDVGGEGLQ